MTRVVKKDGMVFVTQLSDLERSEIHKLKRVAATEQERREALAAFLQRRGFEVTENDERIFAWI